jgi:hypothetical protein
VKDLTGAVREHCQFGAAGDTDLSHEQRGAIAMRSAIQPAFGRRTRRKNLFARILEALHVSRRIEARRLLRRYRHLVAEDFKGQLINASPVLNNLEESRENADRDKTLIRAGHRTFQNA